MKSVVCEIEIILGGTGNGRLVTRKCRLRAATPLHLHLTSPKSSRVNKILRFAKVSQRRSLFISFFFPLGFFASLFAVYASCVILLVGVVEVVAGLESSFESLSEYELWELSSSELESDCSDSSWELLLSDSDSDSDWGFFLAIFASSWEALYF